MPARHHVAPIRRWRLAEVVDLEVYLARPADAALEARAREALADVRQRPPRVVLGAWLALQRQREATLSQGLSPGLALARAQALLRALAGGLGLLAGIALVGAWLGRGGSEPVNAPLFWLAAVGVQTFFGLLALAGWALRHRLGGLTGWLHGVLQGGHGLGRWLLRTLPGEQRQELQATLVRLSQRSRRHARLLTAPAWMLTQRAAVAFNIGLLGALLVLHLPLSDVRFGWQSSYDVSSGEVQQVLAAIATPWREALPRAVPTLAEVALTRTVPGQGVATVPADAGRAWWPFIALSIAVYGFVPRALVFLGLGLLQRRRLATLPVEAEPAAAALLRRLQGPLVQVQGGEAALPEARPPAEAGVAPGTGVALVASELGADDTALLTRLARQGWLLERLSRVALDDRAALAAHLAGQPLGGLTPVVVAGAQRDPIVAIARALREVAQAPRPSGPLLLLLAEEPAPPEVDPEAWREERLRVWQRFAQIQQLPLEVQWLPA